MTTTTARLTWTRTDRGYAAEAAGSATEYTAKAVKLGDYWHAATYTHGYPLTAVMGRTLAEVKAQVAATYDTVETAAQG